MSGLRWTTYDERDPDWARNRRRRALAWTAAAAAGMTVIATVAALGGATETVDTGLLERKEKAELAAIDTAHEVKVKSLQKQNEAEKAGAQASYVADVASQQAAYQVELAGLDAATASQLQDVAAREAAATTDAAAQAARDRAAIDGFFNDVLTALGPDTQVPSKAAIDNAKRALEARKSAELSALNAANTASHDALDAQNKQAVAALDAESKRADDQYAATKADIDRTKRAAEDRIAADATADKAAIDADTTTIKARHAQERLTLAQVHAAQTAAVATASSAVRSALSDRQRQERDDLASLQSGELGAQDAAKKQVDADASIATAEVGAKADTDAAAAKAAYTAAHDALGVALAATKADGDAQLRALDAQQALASDTVKQTYDTAINAIAKGQSAVKAAKTSRLAAFDADAPQRAAALAGRFAVERKRLARNRADRGAAADRGRDDALRTRKRKLDTDLSVLSQDLRQRITSAERDRDRQKRLVKSKYFSLKIRAVEFLENPSLFDSVEHAYDPAIDPGSLYNVARRVGLDRVPDATGAGVDVALIDTGVVDVPGLAEANVEVGPDFSFEDVVPDLRARDTNGHGTHLGGIIAGRDAAWVAGDHARRPDRFLGMAPDARLISIKAGAADGSVDVTQIIAAINWVVANRTTDGHNIRVINLAFGTDSVQDYRTDPLTYAVERAWQAGIVVVVAAGNDGWAAPQLTSPAKDPYVLAVAASQAVSDREIMPADYSNGSASGRTADLAAPGRSIVSLRNPGSFSDEVNEAGRTGDRFVRGSGTSQATAVTSGAVAALLSARPNLTPDQVKAMLQSSADRPADDVALVGAGYLRVDKAVKADVPFTRQVWERSTGTGTMDGARGSVRVVRDGVVLEGDLDIFGTDWSGSKWSSDAWTGSKWSGSKWSGSKWSGSKWSSDLWSGTAWSGSKWSSSFWTGSKWSGSKWSADGWSGSKWSGSKWSAGGWFGVGWGDGPSSTPDVGEEPVTPAAQAMATAG